MDSACLQRMDNRPLRFEEFEEKVNQIIYVSATPGPYELEHTPEMVEQIIRPTGLLDPIIDVRPIEGQIDDLIGEIQERAERDERVLVTTLDEKDVGGFNRLFEGNWH